MFHLSILFLVIAIVCGSFGFVFSHGAATWPARFLALIFFVLFGVTLAAVLTNKEK